MDEDTQEDTAPLLLPCPLAGREEGSAFAGRFKGSLGREVFMRVRALLVLCMFFILACGASQIEITATPQENAWYACKLFIEQQLDIPSTDAQDYVPSRVTTLPDDQFRVEVYYADYGATYICELERLSNGDTKLLSLNSK